MKFKNRTLIYYYFTKSKARKKYDEKSIKGKMESFYIIDFKSAPEPNFALRKLK